MRYLIKYTKESEIKFIAHLDLMRTIQKVVRRAQLPVKYSKGFNPHMALSIAQPLSVGVYSSGEYMDLILTEEVDEQEIIDRLNEKTASGIKFLTATRIVDVENQKKLPQAMALIDACRYIIKVQYNDSANLEEELKTLLEEKEWNTIKKSKKGEREVDIKALVYDFKFWIKDNELVINTLIQSGSREHLSADLLVNYIKEKTTGANLDAFVDIKREEMYYLKGEKFEPLCKVTGRMC
ncbi:TIGR03936 family radical SAM-associated protein [uncultured Clostridium sp.]|uniref:TIGR03936 family radical SAM-associated protein n=1 Tax=uncultured Clostridium sp. TaxID=59620 RepID=UPI0025E77A06|nr:TIGR03936 family radical SAM-associated protein [uncultured Clostridium sp.]